jgi:hypothetical protein
MARKSWYSWSPALPRGQRRGGGIQENNPLPLSDAQLGIWFAQTIDESSPAYNLAEYLEIGGPVDATLFEMALRQVVNELTAQGRSLVLRPIGRCRSSMSVTRPIRKRRPNDG